MTSTLPTLAGPWPAEELTRFRDTYFYAPEAILIQEITHADKAEGLIHARVNARAPWLVAPYQRGDEILHPRHVSGADIIMMTAALGSLHAYFFHGCRWDEGWVGFGSRIENAEFLKLAETGRPIELVSKETKTRVGKARVLLEFAFEFSQEGKPFYKSKQLAMFVRPEIRVLATERLEDADLKR